MRYLIRTFLAVLLVAGLSGCSDFLDPSTEQSKTPEQGIQDAGDLAGLVQGAYDRMNQTEYYGRNFVIYGSVRSDNAFSTGASGRFVPPSNYTMNWTSGYAAGTWEAIYEVIASANIVINADIESNQAVNYRKGQAYAIRALAHMDLLRLFGAQHAGGDMGVPYVTTYAEGNTTPSRMSVSETWDMIGDDFNRAQNLMTPSMDAGSGSSIDPTVMTTVAVNALKARYHLYAGEYDSVQVEAQKVMNSGKVGLASAGNYASTWSADGSSNTIFELAFTTSDALSFSSLGYMLLETDYGDVEMSPELYNLYGSGDVRLDLTMQASDGAYRTTKYTDPAGTNNVQVIRYAEVVLMYAEALARTNQPAQALTELNKIPNHRNAQTYTSPTNLVDKILLERRKELGMEGFRFYTLMRNGMGVDRNVQGYELDISYGSEDLLFPIPQGELDANPNIEQNPGYQGGG